MVTSLYLLALGEIQTKQGTGENKMKERESLNDYFGRGWAFLSGVTILIFIIEVFAVIGFLFYCVSYGYLKI